MKTLLRNTIAYTAILFAIPYLIPGVKIGGGFATFLLGGILLTLMGFTIRPILGVISFPFNLLTMGLFSILTDVIILYLLTVLLPKVTINGYTFEGFRMIGFVVPRFELNTFFAYCITAIFIAGIMMIFNWLIK
jgi:putative membrane protein